MAKDNEALLKEIREEFDYYSDAWREILDEGRDDMQYLSGDPWTQAEKDARENAGRPIVSFDELTQYVNQIINDVRMNKRSIKVTPVSEDATTRPQKPEKSLSAASSTNRTPRQPTRRRLKVRCSVAMASFASRASTHRRRASTRY
jgi:hypothetical protein